MARQHVDERWIARIKVEMPRIKQFQDAHDLSRRQALHIDQDLPHGLVPAPVRRSPTRDRNHSLPRKVRVPSSGSDTEAEPMPPPNGPLERNRLPSHIKMQSLSGRATCMSRVQLPRRRPLGDKLARMLADIFLGYNRELR